MVSNASVISFWYIFVATIIYLVVAIDLAINDLTFIDGITKIFIRR
jgi:hypothetical protein